MFDFVSVDRHVPMDLKALSQWILWRFEGQPGSKPSKVPYQVNGKRASTTSQTHWSSFEQCSMALKSQVAGGQFNGLGFVFSGSDGLVGIDLDNCLNESGQLEPWASWLVQNLESVAYLEVSPSGLGIKAWLKAGGLSKGRKFDVPGAPGSRVEVYPSGRYFTVTGQAWPNCNATLSDGQDCLEMILEWISEQDGKSINESQAGQTEPPPLESLGVYSNRPEAMERARLYLERCEPAISGAGGHHKTLATCGAVATGFDLGEEEAFQVMKEWNDRCIPPWSENELRRKIREAISTSKKPRGHLLEESELPGNQSTHFGVDLSQLGKEREWRVEPSQLADSLKDSLGSKGESLIARVTSFRDMAIGWKLRDEQTRLANRSELKPFDLELPPKQTFLYEFSQWMTDNSPRHQPNIALISAIATMAVLAGRKVQEPSGQRCNLYFLALAESGHGKDFPLKQPGQLLALAGNPELVWDAEATSDAALLTELRKTPNVLWAADEFGKFFSRLKKSKEGFQSAILDQMLKLFTSESDICYRGKSYADDRNNYVINCPHLTLLGVTTPEPVLKALTGEDVSTGLLNRMLIVPGHEMSELREKDRPQIPYSLIEFAKFWPTYNPAGALAASFGSEVQTIPMSKQAKDLFRIYSRQCDEATKTGGPSERNLWIRAYQKAKRLALVCACSRITKTGVPVLRANGVGIEGQDETELKTWSADRLERLGLVIDSEAAQWAISTVSRITDWMVQLVEMHVSDSQREANVKKMLSQISTAGKRGLSRSDVINKNRSMDAKTRDEILRDLLESGEVVRKTEGTGGRAKLVFLATKNIH